MSPNGGATVGSSRNSQRRLPQRMGRRVEKFDANIGKQMNVSRLLGNNVVLCPGQNAYSQSTGASEYASDVAVLLPQAVTENHEPVDVIDQCLIRESEVVAASD